MSARSVKWATGLTASGRDRPAGAVGDERHAGLGGGHRVDPGRRRRPPARPANRSRKCPAITRHPSGSGERRMSSRVTTRSTSPVRPRRERGQGEDARVVRPDRGGEPDAARAGQRLERARTRAWPPASRDARGRAPDPRRRPPGRRLRPAVRDQLAHAIAVAPGRRRTTRRLDEGRMSAAIAARSRVWMRV